MKKLTFALAIISLVTLMALSVNAEMYLWNEVKIREDVGAVSQYGYFQFYDDIEAISNLDQVLLDLKRSLYAGRTVDLTLYGVVEHMPYNTTNYTIDYCEFNVTHLKTNYDNEGNLISTNETTYGWLYTSNPTANITTVYLELRNRDSVTYDMRCYYNDTDYLYDESILFGSVTTYLPANKCNDCEEYTLEELSNEIERTDDIIEEETAIYRIVQTLFDFDFQIWLIVSWLVKILAVVVAISLAFYGVYHLFLFLRDIEGQIK